MSELEPNYTNIIKQELEIGDLSRALATVTSKLERLQQFVDRSEWGQERERLHVQLDISKYSNDLLHEQLEAQSVTLKDNLTEIQLLKAQVKCREKEVDRMMAQRNLAEAKLLVLEQREVGYLSELDDYARTVLNLRSRVKACEAEHGTRNDYDKV